MRGISYFLVVTGVVAAQGNLTVQTSQTPPSPSATTNVDTEVFSIAGYGKPTCQAVTVTVTEPKKTKTETITSTCYETKTVHDTKTLTSTTTCTEVSCPPFCASKDASAEPSGRHCKLYRSQELCGPIRLADSISPVTHKMNYADETLRPSRNQVSISQQQRCILTNGKSATPHADIDRPRLRPSQYPILSQGLRCLDKTTQLPRLQCVHCDTST